MKVIIRPAKIKDAKILSEINRECLPENYDLQYWEEHLAKKCSHVAEVGKLPIGYILATDEWVVSFAVCAKYRQKGIGQLLMNHYLYDMQQKQSPKVSLHVDCKNQTAMKLYEGMGFKRQEHVINYYTDRGADAFVMVNPLTEPILKPLKKIKIAQERS